jgi:hypothetical protein
VFDCGSVACDILSFRSRGSGGLVANVVGFLRDCLRVVVSGVVRTPLCRYGEDCMRKYGSNVSVEGLAYVLLVGSGLRSKAEISEVVELPASSSSEVKGGCVIQ